MYINGNIISTLQLLIIGSNLGIYHREYRYVKMWWLYIMEYDAAIRSTELEVHIAINGYKSILVERKDHNQIYHAMSLILLFISSLIRTYFLRTQTKGGYTLDRTECLSTRMVGMEAKR